MFTHTDMLTLDGQAGMSMQGDSLEYEYRRRLREREAGSNRLSCHGGAPRQRRMSVYYKSSGQRL